jgi:hypothetical protein
MIGGASLIRTRSARRHFENDAERRVLGRDA